MRRYRCIRANAAIAGAAPLSKNAYKLPGLATVFRGAVDHEKLNQAMRLENGQFITFPPTKDWNDMLNPKLKKKHQGFMGDDRDLDQTFRLRLDR